MGSFVASLVEGDRVTVTATLVLGFLLLQVSRIAYRCYWSPLAQIPGPRLAAATGWYETYYDFFQGGQWPKQLRRLHEEYGPIVRINPYEVHVQDPSFTNSLYMSRHGKDPKWVSSLGQDLLSAGTTLDHEKHRLRRGAMDPFFTRGGIMKRIETVERTVDKLVARVEEARRQKQVICVDDMYTALTLDVIALFCYGKGYGYLDRADFAREWRLMMRDVFESPALVRAFPVMGLIIKSLPASLVKAMNPALREFLFLQDDCRRQIQAVIEAQSKRSQAAPNNVFEQILASDLLPPEDKTINRLVPEGVGIIAAGSDTTAKALSITTFHLVRNPKIQSRLRMEIDEAIKSNKLEGKLSWTQLESLPWLSAVVKEGTRIAGSVSSRSPRVLEKDIQYHQYHIPAGTTVSQTMYLLLTEPSTFPQPYEFRPERWLAQDSSGHFAIDKSMNEYMVAFTKGPRACLGMWLAQAEMYLVLAKLFSQYDFELVETDERDVLMARDRFLPYPVAESKGVRVRVTRTRGVLE